MATFVGVRSLNRNRLRVGTTQVYPNSTTQIDLDVAANRRDLQRHSAIGAIAIVAANNSWVNAAGTANPGATTLTANS